MGSLRECHERILVTLKPINLSSTIAFPLGVRPTDQIFYYLVLQHVSRPKFAFKHQNADLGIGGHHLVLQVRRMISGNSGRR